MSPSYRALYASGELQRRAEILNTYYTSCVLCPHQCGVDRTNGGRGICNQGSLPVVASHNLHNGEEPPISGESGSGTIFFSGCTGTCIFCQNYPISQLGTGNIVSVARLAKIMIELQGRGCHNINFVTPTHFLPSIVSALVLAAEQGLKIPLVYNTSGYERLEILRFLDGIIDVYLPDAKYADNTIAAEISGFQDYTKYNKAALIEMWRQIGELVTVDGIAQKGMIVRHLILPDDLSGTKNVLTFLAGVLSTDIHVSLMNQYFPAYKSTNHKTLNRRITGDEYKIAIEIFDALGLHNGWIQEHNFV